MFFLLNEKIRLIERSYCLFFYRCLRYENIKSILTFKFLINMKILKKENRTFSVKTSRKDFDNFCFADHTNPKCFIFLFL